MSGEPDSRSRLWQHVDTDGFIAGVDQVNSHVLVFTSYQSANGGGMLQRKLTGKLTLEDCQSHAVLLRQKLKTLRKTLDG